MLGVWRQPANQALKSLSVLSRGSPSPWFQCCIWLLEARSILNDVLWKDTHHLFHLVSSILHVAYTQEYGLGDSLWHRWRVVAYLVWFVGQYLTLSVFDGNYDKQFIRFIRDVELHVSGDEEKQWLDRITYLSSTSNWTPESISSCLSSTCMAVLPFHAARPGVLHWMENGTQNVGRIEERPATIRLGFPIFLEMVYTPPRTPPEPNTASPQKSKRMSHEMNKMETKVHVETKREEKQESEMDVNELGDTTCVVHVRILGEDGEDLTNMTFNIPLPPNPLSIRIPTAPLRRLLIQNKQQSPIDTEPIRKRRREEGSGVLRVRVGVYRRFCTVMKNEESVLGLLPSAECLRDAESWLAPVSNVLTYYIKTKPHE